MLVFFSVTMDKEAREEENQEPNPDEPEFFSRASVEKVMAHLKTSTKGLSANEVKARQKEHGRNEAWAKKPKGEVAKRILAEFQKQHGQKANVLRDGAYIELPAPELVIHLTPNIFWFIWIYQKKTS